MAGVGRRRAGLLRRGLTMGAVATVVALGGCGDDGDGATAAKTTSEKTVDPQVRARLMEIGERVFDEHCHACHTMLGRKHAKITSGEPPGTNFDEIKPVRAYVWERIRYGGIAMQSFESEISEREKRAITLYVAEVSGRDLDPAADEGTDAELATGEQIFEQRCHSCHTLGGEKYTGPDEKRGINFDGVKVSVRWVERMVRRGNVFMKPMARGLGDAEIRALAKYVQSTSGEGKRGEI